MSNVNTRKSCAVPKCTNTTTKAPEKLFFLVPMGIEMRKEWLKAMKRSDPLGDKSKVYCCEDHFDIENDMENYIRYKLVGGRLKLKKGIVPHKFQCQQVKKDKTESSAVQKLNQIKHYEKLLDKDEGLTSNVCEISEMIFVDCCEEDPLSFENNDQHLIMLKKKTKNKGVQVNLKDNGVHKSTMTDVRYFKRVK